MKRVIGASTFGLGVVLVTGCFAPVGVYGSGSWYAATTVVHTSVSEPMTIAAVDSAPSMEPLGEWVWLDGAWRWVSSAMIGAPGGVPIADAVATTKRFDDGIDRVELAPPAERIEITNVAPPIAPAPVMVEETHAAVETIEDGNVRVTVVPLRHVAH